MSTLEVTRVSDLAAIAEGVSRTPVTVAVSDMSVIGNELQITGLSPLLVDELATEKLAKQFGMPASYLVKGDPELRAWNLNHCFSKQEGFISIYSVGDNLVGLSDPDRKSLPLGTYLRGIVNNFDPNDEVVEYHNDPSYLHVDIVTDAQIVVPGIEGVESRPMVGDITKGGIRVIAYPDLDKPPVLQTYTHRLWCTNGATHQEEDAKISLRGKTIAEIDEEFNSIIANLKIGIGSRLENYRESAEIPIEGEIAHFMYNMAHEAGLSRNVTNRVMDLRSTLPENPSVYDVVQVFTSVANESVNYNSRLRLQGVGGYLVGDTEHALNRCVNCQHTFIDYSEV